MIVITVEIWPFGYKDNRRTLSTAHIWNDGTGTNEIGNYGYRVFDENNKIINKGVIKNYPRRLMVWNLIYRILRKVLRGKINKGIEILKGENN